MLNKKGRDNKYKFNKAQAIKVLVAVVIIVKVVVEVAQLLEISIPLRILHSGSVNEKGTMLKEILIFVFLFEFIFKINNSKIFDEIFIYITKNYK